MRLFQVCYYIFQEVRMRYQHVEILLARKTNKQKSNFLNRLRYWMIMVAVIKKKKEETFIFAIMYLYM